MTAEASYLIIEECGGTASLIVTTSHAQSYTRATQSGGDMAKLHARPSNQYRYEHYDPRF